MFKTSCELFTGHIEASAAVNDSEPASITISWLQDLSLHLLPLPPSSRSFMQSGHNLQTAILSNGYRSFIPSLLFGRRSL